MIRAPLSFLRAKCKEPARRPALARITHQAGPSTQW